MLIVDHKDRRNQQSEQDNWLVWLFHFHSRLVHNVFPHIGIDYLEFLLDHQEMLESNGSL